MTFEEVRERILWIQDELKRLEQEKKNLREHLQAECAHLRTARSDWFSVKLIGAFNDCVMVCLVCGKYWNGGMSRYSDEWKRAEVVFAASYAGHSEIYKLRDRLKRLYEPPAVFDLTDETDPHHRLRDAATRLLEGKE